MVVTSEAHQFERVDSTNGATGNTSELQVRSRVVSTPLEVGHSALHREAASDLPWYRQVTRDQWRAFWAVFLGWIVDSFDFNILAFIIIDIQQSFTVDRALAGLLGTVTLMMRLVGGTIAGYRRRQVGDASFR